ncbi:RNA exonuclease [Acrasis kona]|uniref:RNA exonuclease n=1 Tax=Acrasis kona TaxID=1008807 RepID=A0AAW2ZLH8_9EUKA
MDCEMCYTKNGLELTRITLVGEDGSTIYDEFVKPESPITDYNTRYSGITEKHLENVTRTYQQARDQVLELVSKDTILVGHSLENDLTSLHLIHRKIIDTAISYSDLAVPESVNIYKKSLRTLSFQYLNRAIQEGSNGHDSVEDALAALDLVKLKFVKGPLFGRQDKGSGGAIMGESVIELINKNDKNFSLVDRSNALTKITAGAASTISGRNDKELVDRAIKEIRSEYNDVTWLHLYDLNDCYENKSENLDQALSDINDSVKQVYDALPKNCMCVIMGGCGNLYAVENMINNGEDNDKIDNFVHKISTGFVLCGIK